MTQLNYGPIVDMCHFRKLLSLLPARLEFVCGWRYRSSVGADTVHSTSISS